MIITTFFLAAALTVNVTKVEQVYDKKNAERLVPMLSEILHYPTYAGNAEAHAAQKVWLTKTATKLGFVVRDAGKITEIELPGPSAMAPVLGLVVHGDVQPVEEKAWTFKPFDGRVSQGFVYGRGSADDKGPLIQALLAMHSLKTSEVTLTHTVRLLVGSTEESDGAEMGEYLKTHTAPDYSLVLDSAFPVVVGEKAWNSLNVTTSLDERGPSTLPYTVTALTAGLAPSIVPDHAEITLRWKGDTPDWASLAGTLSKISIGEGTHLLTTVDGPTMQVAVHGHSAHAGVNLEGGRNALVSLARAMEGRLPEGGANDLLAFARMAGQDIYGTGLGVTSNDPIWGRYAVNVATIAPEEKEPAKSTLVINIRSTPPQKGLERQAYFFGKVAEFNKRTGSSLTPGGYWGDEPLGFDPGAKLVKRLLADYAHATGTPEKPAISGGGTYAKRLPNAIAFGMWFPGKPYPGHDVDEKISIEDLQRGEKVLIEVLVDIATGPRIREPFRP